MLEMDDSIDDLIDDLMENGFEPRPWMQQMERVVDAYKAETELMRRHMREYASRLMELEKIVSEMQHQQQKISRILAQFEK